jgi:sulfate adenylyltransferase large subunit
MPGLLRFTTAGSVDDGKSTLIGRLLYDSKGIYEDQLSSVRNASVNRSAGPIDFSLLTDGLRAEREQGITIDVAYRYFSTPKRKFIIADTPGHEQYTRNMATGASTAQLAVVLVDARKGVLPQSRRHAYIASLLGIPHVVVAVNKMDLVAFSAEVFRAIEDEFREFVREFGFTRLAFVPVSALDGDNIVSRSDRTPWYTGPSLLELLETAPGSEADVQAGDLRFPVQYVVRPSLDFRGYAGQVASGVVRKGDAVTVVPSGRASRVRSLVTFDGELEEAGQGTSVTITLEDEIDISRGDMLVHPSALPLVSRLFEARVVWMHSVPMQTGRTYLVKHTTQQVSAAAVEILHKTDVNTLARLPAERLELNEIGTVRFDARRPLFFDPYRTSRATGSFIVIDPISNLTVGAGMIRGAWMRERSFHRVTAEERQRRNGHAGFTVSLPGRLEVAYMLERELFDRGCAVYVAGENAPSPEPAATGVIAISTRSLAGVEAGFDPLPESDSEAVSQVIAVLESRGLIRRERTGLDGDGI